jgi:GNAT superfamily N-acetyltransferase
MSGLRIEKLSRVHDTEHFECGKDALNRFLIRHALQSQQAGATSTYLALDGPRVVGFYSLVVGEIAYAEAAARLTKGLARHPVPVMVLARLAISTDYQGKGLGSGLLKDAMVRTLQAADLAGIRALVVHAKDDEARRFYERYGFEPSPTDAHHLYALLKDVRKTMG